MKAYDENQYEIILKKEGYSIFINGKTTLLGQGQFSSVYQGVDLTFGKNCSIKISKKQKDQGLQNEYNNTCSIQCYQRVVKPIQLITAPFNILICKKGKRNLKDELIEGSFKLSQQSVAKIFMDILLSLQSQHVNGRAHKDIKLENVIVLKKHYALIDWSSTDDDFPYFTVRYALPIIGEIFQKNKKFSSDIFLSGMLFMHVVFQKKLEQDHNYQYEFGKEQEEESISTDILSLYSITKYCLLNQNPYLRYSLPDAIDSYLTCLKKEISIIYKESEVKRISEIIENPKDVPDQVLVSYYYYLHKMQKHQITDKYLKLSRDILDQCTFNQIDVIIPLVYLEQARFEISQKKYMEALVYLKQGFDKLLSNSPFQNYSYFQFQICLGDILFQKEQYKKSKETFKQIKKQCMKVYGIKHPLYLEIKAKLLLSKMKCYLKRIQLVNFLELEYQCRILFSFDHPFYAEVLLGMAKYSEKETSYHRQLEFIKEALVLLLKFFDKNSIEISNCYYELSNSYLNLENSQQALKAAQKSFHIKCRIYKQVHPSIPSSCLQISKCHHQLREQNKAIISLKYGLDIIRKHFSYDTQSYEQLYLFLCQIHEGQQQSQYILDNYPHPNDGLSQQSQVQDNISDYLLSQEEIIFKQYETKNLSSQSTYFLATKRIDEIREVHKLGSLNNQPVIKKKINIQCQSEKPSNKNPIIKDNLYEKANLNLVKQKYYKKKQKKEFKYENPEQDILCSRRLFDYQELVNMRQLKNVMSDKQKDTINNYQIKNINKFISENKKAKSTKEYTNFNISIQIDSYLKEQITTINIEEHSIHSKNFQDKFNQYKNSYSSNDKLSNSNSQLSMDEVDKQKILITDNRLFETKINQQMIFLGNVDQKNIQVQQKQDFSYQTDSMKLKSKSNQKQSQIQILNLSQLNQNCHNNFEQPLIHPQQLKESFHNSQNSDKMMEINSKESMKNPSNSQENDSNSIPITIKQECQQQLQNIDKQLQGRQNNQSSNNQGSVDRMVGSSIYSNIEVGVLNQEINLSEEQKNNSNH